MAADRMTFAGPGSADLFLPYINRALEFLWLAAVVLVPLAFIDRDHAVSEAVIAYVEVPKIALLRTIAGLMAVLWLLEWAIRTGVSSESSFAWTTPKLSPSTLWSKSAAWLRGHPDRWLFLAVWLFLGSTLIATVFSGAFETSLWGEIPGQDGYATYTIASYVLLFSVIATHLKTKAQTDRLIIALVGMGVLVGGYAIFQHYGSDFLGLTEDTGGGAARATSFMGNSIFSAAVLSMTIPITLIAGTITFRDSANRRGNLGRSLTEWLVATGISTGWGACLAVQLLGITFTQSRGPWLGTALALVTFLFLLLLFAGWRTFSRGALVLGLAFVLALAVLQWQGSVSILDNRHLTGALIALAGFTGAGVVHFNWRIFGWPAIFLGTGLMVVAAGVLGPSGLKNIGGLLGDQPGTSDLPVSDTAVQVRDRFSSIGSEVLTGFSGGRSTHWRVSWRLIRDRPWFDFDELHVRWLRPLVGYGPDLFRFTYLLESPAEGVGIRPLEPDNAHNYFIHQTVEQGVLGLFSSIGIFLAAFLGGGYLLRRRRGIPSPYDLLIIGVVATLAGRALEMTVGVARVSDLTVLWVILALLTALEAIVRPSQVKDGVGEGPVPIQRRTTRHRSRRGQGTSSIIWRPQNLRPLWRLVLVAWLVGGIGILTWVKGVNYVRAAVSEGQAVQHFKTNDYQATLTSLDRAIELAPDVPVYHTNRATLYLAYLVNKKVAPESGCSLVDTPPYDVCLAIQSYSSNLLGASKRPLYYRSRVAAGHSSSLLQLDSQAVNHYSQSVSMLPNSWILANYLGDAYIQAGQPDAALQPLLNSLRITEGNSQSAYALYYLGVAYQNVGETERSLHSLEDSLSFGLPMESAFEAHRMLTDLYDRIGRPRSLDILNRAIERNPGDVGSYYFRAVAYSKSGQYERAIQDYAVAIRLDTLPPRAPLFRPLAHVGLGKAFVVQDRLEEALGEFGTAFKLDPKLTQAYVLRGKVNLALRRYEDAVQDFNEAIQLSPTLHQAFALRGRAFLSQGRGDPVVPELLRAGQLRGGK